MGPRKVIIWLKKIYVESMQDNKDLEVALPEAISMVANGSRIMLFESSYSDVQLLSETFSISEESVGIIDMNDFQVLNLHYGEEDGIKKIAGKFEGSVIVCPHGNTSRLMAELLAKEGVKAYSLKGGIEGLLHRG